MEFKIYTKTGDDGTTGLVGGKRVKKSDLRLEAYGTVDELNSWIGLLQTVVENEEVSRLLAEIQNTLFNAGSRLASDETGNKLTENLSIDEVRILNLEKAIDLYETDLPKINRFILPGGSVPSAYAHIARTVCRRGERAIVRLNEVADVEKNILHYINRLSDYLFVLARKLNNDLGVTEVFWVK